MGHSNGVRIPRADSFAFIAGEQLYKTGPAPEGDLFHVLGQVRMRYKHEAMERAVQGGWLTVARGGLIDCSAAARAHYDALAGKVTIKPVGKVAPPREAFNAFERPPLSKKYMTNSRGTRDDVPAWSVRPAGAGFKSVGGGDARPMRFPGKEG